MNNHENNNNKHAEDNTDLYLKRIETNLETFNNRISELIDVHEDSQEVSDYYRGFEFYIQELIKFKSLFEMVLLDNTSEDISLEEILEDADRGDFYRLKTLIEICDSALNRILDREFSRENSKEFVDDINSILLEGKFLDVNRWKDISYLAFMNSEINQVIISTMDNLLGMEENYYSSDDNSNDDFSMLYLLSGNLWGFIKYNVESDSYTISTSYFPTTSEGYNLFSFVDEIMNMTGSDKKNFIQELENQSTVLVEYKNLLFRKFITYYGILLLMSKATTTIGYNSEKKIDYNEVAKNIILTIKKMNILDEVL